MFNNKEFINFIKSSKENNKDIVLINILDSQDFIYKKNNTTMMVDTNGEFVGTIKDGEFKEVILKNAKDILLEIKGRIVNINSKRTTSNIYSWEGNISLDKELKLWMEPFYCNDNFGSLGYALDFALKGMNNTLIRSIKHSGAHSFSPSFDTRNIFFNEKDKLFYQKILSPFKLLILGAHSGCEALVKIADILGWQTTVCDTNELNLINVNSADEKLLLKKTDEVSNFINRNYDAAIIMSNEFNNDISYLKSLLQSNIDYLGIIGSKETTKVMIETLKKSKNIKIDSKLYDLITWNMKDETQQSLALSICSDIEAYKNNIDKFNIDEEEALLSKSA